MSNSGRFFVSLQPQTKKQILLMTKEMRIVFVDYLRVIACFLVMLVHASENFYAADASGLAGNVSMLANEQNRFWVAFYDGTLGRISVPLFMLASAFLLVPLKPGVGTPIQARAATHDSIYAALYLSAPIMGTDDMGKNNTGTEESMTARESL